MTHQRDVADRLAQLRREKSARERRDVTQGEIAGAIGIAAETYSRYENGKRGVPEEVIMALADYFATSAPYIRYGVAAATSGPAAPEPVPAERIAELRAKRAAARDRKKADGKDHDGPGTRRASGDRPRRGNPRGEG